ncbi:hypothetical protein JAAARDRAFT_113007, partial [Jaapia argillacea MUCL 33604]
ARLGHKFPPHRVGTNWTHCFVTKYLDRLSMYTVQPLDTTRACGVNPTTNSAWFELLRKVLKKGDSGKLIAPECCWGVDESGFQSGLGDTQEKAIGRKGKKIQYQQQDGDRENITIIVTIGADGLSTPPAVIFKGKGYQTKWKQDNPSNALLGYSKKGWTNGKIGQLWIQQFNKFTREKANGRTQVLFVDGYNSHYTQGFLKYARIHNIHILCYLSHLTQIYQGLDVMVFSVLKRFWIEECDWWEREEGEKVSKQNFLAVYGHAHICALTPTLIKMAFQKTEVWPYDPSVVSTEMLAPSIETLCKGILPLVPSTPIRIIGKLM